MNYDHAILVVNSSSIILLIMLAVVLLMATTRKRKRKHKNIGYAALVIIVPTIPVYLYNMSRMLGWSDLALATLPLAYSVNTLQMPLLWLFTVKSFNPEFKFRPRDLLHLLPMATCLVFVVSIGHEARMQNIMYEATGDDMLLGDLNTLIILVQLIAYFIAIFIYINKQRRLVGETLTDAEWAHMDWIRKFMILYASLFVVVMVAYAIFPRTDAWLIQILNVIAMYYLTYNAIMHHPEHLLPLPTSLPSDEDKEFRKTAPLSDGLMEDICHQVNQYLNETKAFLRPDLSLALLAFEMKIPQRNLSRAINTHMGCNFFTLINNMRVEEAKRLLLELKSENYNIDSISTECGFCSRSTFFLVFKRHTGKSPAAWLLSNKQ